MKDLRKKLFEGWAGCSNHGCIVTGPKKGMGTNGSCHCISSANRGQLNMLQGRLNVFIQQSEIEQSAKVNPD